MESIPAGAHFFLFINRTAIHQFYSPTEILNPIQSPVD